MFLFFKSKSGAESGKGTDEVSTVHSWWVKNVQLSLFDVLQRMQGSVIGFLSLLRFPQESLMLFKQTFKCIQTAFKSRQHLKSSTYLVLIPFCEDCRKGQNRAKVRPVVRDRAVTVTPNEAE